MALLGFAQLVLVAVELLWPSRVSSSAVSGFTNLQGVQMSRELVTALEVSPHVTSSVGYGWLWVLAVAVLGVAAWYFVLARRAGTPPRTGRFVLLVLGALVAVPLLDLLGFLQFRLDADVRGPMITTLALVLLAWFERSALVLVVTAVFVLVAVVFLPGLPGVLVSAVALLAGAFAALVAPAGPDPGTAADTA
ncbi:hypothetical protein GCM10023192_63020 [Amycolatopsis samaneae]